METLAAQKARKAKLLAGAAEFNAKPKRGIEFLKEHGLIDEEAEPGEKGTVLALRKVPTQATKARQEATGGIPLSTR